MIKKTLNPGKVFNSLQYGFSQAVITEGGRRMYLSGQVGTDTKEQTVGTNLETQADAAIKNIAAILESSDGGNLTHVVMLRIYIVDSARDEQEQLVNVLQKYFPKDPPATSWVFVNGLSEPEWLVEIEAEAVLPE